MADTTDFIAYFSILPDPRVDRTKKHRLIDILFIAVCTIICGGETFTDMEMFGEAKKEWLSTLLELPHGIPSHDTFGRVFSLLDPQAFGECFLRWSAALHEATKAEVIALDGKTLRYSFDTATGQAALHLVSAWGIENSLHWVLDVIMNEDQNRIRKDHAPENMALMRRLALNLIKKARPAKKSVRGSIKSASWDNSFLKAILVAG